MKSLLCPCCYYNFLRKTKSSSHDYSKTEQLKCPRCKSTFRYELAISDTDKIVPVVCKSLFSKSFDWISYILELIYKNPNINNELSIELLSIVCDNYDTEFLNKVNSKAFLHTINYPYSRAVMLRISKKGFIKKCFKLVMVFPVGNCILPDYLPIDEYIRYASKYIFFKCSDFDTYKGFGRNDKVLTNLAHIYRSYNNLSRSKKVSVPLAIVYFSKFNSNYNDDICFESCLRCEFQNWNTFMVVEIENEKHNSKDKTLVFKELILWAIK